MSLFHLVPFFCGNASDLLGPLADRIRKAFGTAVELHRPCFDPELAFDASRGQYNTRILLAQLAEHQPPVATRVLGVTGIDLFIPVLTYVFGEAQLEGRAAVVSAYRLENQLYGLPADHGLLLNRLAKESVHELGHTYRLFHCTRYPCVMASSTYVEDLDMKAEEFCAACRNGLGANQGPS
ncbi:MAG: archaemetzincin family Zn-dependent metalloprotease [Thermoguttaceae bacterium]